MRLGRRLLRFVGDSCVVLLARCEDGVSLGSDAAAAVVEVEVLESAACTFGSIMADAVIDRVFVLRGGLEGDKELVAVLLLAASSGSPHDI